MKINHLSKLFLATLLVTVSFPIPLKAQNKTVLENIQETGLIRVGIREDAVPFGYRNADNNLSGLCLDFVNQLRRQLQQELKRNIFTVKIFQSTLFNRFDLIEDQVIDLECGPNSIQTEPSQFVSFSKPFLVTGIQFLIRKDDQLKFNVRGTLEGVTIGVLRNTSTEKFIRTRYPLATIQQFQGTTGRVRGIQALQRGRIDAFVSDGILLIGEATLLGLDLEKDYVIVPTQPLTCEYYGLILPKNNPQWQKLVNETIEIARSQLIIADWFSIVDSYIQETNVNCPDINPQ
ncbi:amino acid ABC transporter substrate-binding protein [Aphanothece hegewaldii CCALA 016]|uniref:Amino acid ABC transporter substrate-binding protein n=1 Tax=Aphanothece hegewaldii CCALA 016 TaxID=2107694 RepID=A0A2T1LY92_9CHRO|nr:amino acid ABC transporter substrate-binding protein [Aphanothece hegewaldii]PSF37289.1 amino acid ABC transporter substrate-binding protein [Aphanothece hegewaldii CCALA 016]